MSQPTFPEPVNERWRIRGSVTSGSAAAWVIGMIEKAPSGRPASARISPMISAPIGVFEAGLRTKGQPIASAGATLWATRLSGKLKGVMKAQGPTATRLVIPR